MTESTTKNDYDRYPLSEISNDEWATYIWRERTIIADPERMFIRGFRRTPIEEAEIRLLLEINRQATLRSLLHDLDKLIAALGR